MIGDKLAIRRNVGLNIDPEWETIVLVVTVIGHQISIDMLAITLKMQQIGWTVSGRAKNEHAN